ncbi:hypothetical protein [Paenilisteria newyorkensis]|uniref:hypothetical protein n=1 Tax=Listeria newyorkensis TaxID=1497681 RepID=UPI000669FB63|nr:hypothetical protein [Listeria newyorkensis]KMT61383.1 putative secreted protein [Listeria newyorkensis]
MKKKILTFMLIATIPMASFSGLTKAETTESNQVEEVQGSDNIETSPIIDKTEETKTEEVQQSATGSKSETPKLKGKLKADAPLAIANPQTFVLGTDLTKVDPKTFVSNVANNGVNMKIEYVTKPATNLVGVYSTTVKVTDLSSQAMQTIDVPTTIQFGDTIFTRSGYANEGLSALTLHHGATPYITNTAGVTSGKGVYPITGAARIIYTSSVQSITTDHKVGTPYFSKSARGDDTSNEFCQSFNTPVNVAYGDIISVYTLTGNTPTSLPSTTATSLDGAQSLSTGTHYFEITPTGYKEVMKSSATAKTVTAELGAKVTPKDCVTLPASGTFTVSDTFIQAPDLKKVGTSQVQVEVREQLDSGQYISSTVTSSVTINADTTPPTADTVTQKITKNAAIPAPETFLTNIHDDADDYTSNKINISYVTEPTTTELGARTCQIALTDSAGNVAYKDATYFVGDETTVSNDQYGLRAEPVVIKQSELTGKTATEKETLIRERSNVQGWDIEATKEVSDQVALSSTDIANLPTKASTTENYTVAMSLGNLTTDIAVTVTDDVTFAFNATPDPLNFESTEMIGDEVTIDRTNPNWNIQVKDTRNNGSKWSITATVNGPFKDNTDPEAKQLHNALTYTKGSTETQILDNQAFAFYEGQSNETSIKTIESTKDQGFRMKVNPTGVKADAEYQTSITWTLNDTP